MQIASFIGIVVVTVLVMEAVAWLLHRYVMHGFMWSIHKTHHEPRKGAFELNDAFGVAFALPSALLINLGTRGNELAMAVGIGISVYGVIYFFFHDMLVHRRVDLGLRPRSGYLARIVQAHRLHHAVQGKDGCVAFGFIFAPSPKRLKKMLAETGGQDMRQPTPRPSA
ncbi:MAG: sterol desaturase family protein [Pseudomonadota bacterium]